MRKLFGIILILMILLSAVNAQENKSAIICNQEIKKKQPQLKRVQKYCIEAGKHYKQMNEYSKALNYY